MQGTDSNSSTYRGDNSHRKKIKFASQLKKKNIFPNITLRKFSPNMLS